MSIKFEKLNNIADKELPIQSFNKLLIELEQLVKEIKEIQTENHKHINQPYSEWLSLKDAAEYASVSYNTFIRFRQMGLKVCEIEGIKRVSRKEINRFLESHSY